MLVTKHLLVAIDFRCISSFCESPWLPANCLVTKSIFISCTCKQIYACRWNVVTVNVIFVMLHCGHKVETQGDTRERESARKCSPQQAGSECLSRSTSPDSLPQLLQLAFPLSAWFPPFVICPELPIGSWISVVCVFDLGVWWTVPLGGEGSLWPAFLPFIFRLPLPLWVL